jgi:general stress protein 26
MSLEQEYSKNNIMHRNRKEPKMEESEIKKECLKLTHTTNLIYLSTNGVDGYPHTRTMTNLRNKDENPVASEFLAQMQDDFIIYFVTSKSSPKMQQIRANPKVSAYFCNPAEFHTLIIAGQIEEITDMEFKKQLWQNNWKIHWPDGAEDTEFTVLKLSPAFAKGFYTKELFEFKI